MGLLSKLFGRGEQKQDKKQLFSTVIGYEDIKEVLQLSLEAKEPVHIMLSGPPACSKTVFLLDLLAANKERAHFIDGSYSSKAGIFDLCFEQRPKFLIIDEIDGLKQKDQKALLNLMETGILSRTIHGKTESTQLPCWIYATLNNPKKLLPALKSRFQQLHLPEYTRADFIEIGTRLLERKGINSESAKTITEIVYDQMEVKDPRQVIRLGKMIGSVDTEKVDLVKLKRVVATCIKYGGPDE